MHYISLGHSCSIAMDLEKMGLRSESLPFDWLISDFKGVMQAIENHFEDFLTYEYMQQARPNRAYYRNYKYNIQFYHDFDKYHPLADQIDAVQEKYNRRIERFYKTISEPTLFIRYITNTQLVDEPTNELVWIEQNYDSILKIIKSFNQENEIIFIANEGTSSSIVPLYIVSPDENNHITWSPLQKQPELYDRLQNAEFPDREANILRYRKKQQKKLFLRVKNKLLSIRKNTFQKEYLHHQLYP